MADTQSHIREHAQTTQCCLLNLKNRSRINVYVITITKQTCVDQFDQSVLTGCGAFYFSVCYGKEIYVGESFPSQDLHNFFYVILLLEVIILITY